MKAISRYQRAISWIAEHDKSSATEGQLAKASHVQLVAHVFEKDPARVAQQVLEARRRSASSDAYPPATERSPTVLFTKP